MLHRRATDGRGGPCRADIGLLRRGDEDFAVTDLKALIGKMEVPYLYRIRIGHHIHPAAQRRSRHVTIASLVAWTNQPARHSTCKLVSAARLRGNAKISRFHRAWLARALRATNQHHASAWLHPSMQPNVAVLHVLGLANARLSRNENQSAPNKVVSFEGFLC
ncbi:hypothetical protein HU200_018899 [Digitaria exilis]|uniref:Uncharacterized protein n=1 Tax=Digitaria exilis TaxID=1010633 RepID=A0A835KFF2_9POAL|nr:hypothetical protein HU200_023936 [Digitaria exilis]KAF8727537.1 hypothetical protein HU200_018899 [Digitaria exilis]